MNTLSPKPLSSTFSIWIVEESKIQSLRLSELTVTVEPGRTAWDAIYMAREQFPELHIIGVSAKTP